MPDKRKSHSSHRKLSIHGAVKQNSLAEVEKALAAGLNVDERDHRNYTPLMLAAESNASPDVVQRLLAGGADVNAECEIPQDPAIQSAMASVSPEMLENLGVENLGLENLGIDASFLEASRNQPPKSQSVLSLAVENSSLSVVEILVQHGANLNWVDNNGYGIALKALFRGIQQEVEDLSLLDFLMDAGAPLDLMTRFGESLVTVAARIGEIKLLKKLRETGADLSVLGWNGLHHAVAFEERETFGQIVPDDPRLNERDYWSLTPLLLAIKLGKPRLAEILLAKGASLADNGRCETSPLGYAIESESAEMVRWLLGHGVDIHAPTNDFAESALQASLGGNVEIVKALIDAGANVYETNEYGFGLLHDGPPPETIDVLHGAGLALDTLAADSRSLYLQLEPLPESSVSTTDYQNWARPKFGKQNPQPMSNAFWNFMVCTRETAYAARRRWGKKSTFDDCPVWCCQRFGQSLTKLPDGRHVEVGGQHEDYYDPDFQIYNDVIVYDRQAEGKTKGKRAFTIYGYPREVFPPTDYHSATYVDGCIFIVGSIGYTNERAAGTTPVFILDCKSWSIQRAETHGEKPGWISKHHARLSNTKIEIWGGEIWTTGGSAKNESRYVLDLASRKWERVG